MRVRPGLGFHGSDLPGLSPQRSSPLLLIAYSRPASCPCPLTAPPELGLPATVFSPPLGSTPDPLLPQASNTASRPRSHSGLRTCLSPHSEDRSHLRRALRAQVLAPRPAPPRPRPSSPHPAPPELTASSVCATCGRSDPATALCRTSGTQYPRPPACRDLTEDLTENIQRTTNHRPRQEGSHPEGQKERSDGQPSVKLGGRGEPHAGAGPAEPRWSGNSPQAGRTGQAWAWADWRRQGLGRRGEPGLLQTHFLPQLDSRRQAHPLKQQQDKRMHTIPRAPRAHTPQPAVWTAGPPSGPAFSNTFSPKHAKLGDFLRFQECEHIQL